MLAQVIEGEHHVEIIHQFFFGEKGQELQVREPAEQLEDGQHGQLVLRRGHPVFALGHSRPPDFYYTIVYQKTDAMKRKMFENKFLLGGKRMAV